VNRTTVTLTANPGGTHCESTHGVGPDHGDRCGGPAAVGARRPRHQPTDPHA
jgi:hypothetical protein